MMNSNRICGQHRIEDRVQVKLLWDDVLGRWYLDSTTDPPTHSVGWINQPR